LQAKLRAERQRKKLEEELEKVESEKLRLRKAELTAHQL
jgi:hypothetical protein